MQSMCQLSIFLSTPSARRATHDELFWDDEKEFLSTPSARRATCTTEYLRNLSVFLSTPSARRATAATERFCARTGYFYPRPPRGGRRQVVRFGAVPLEISIHALREEGDGPRSM